MSSRTINPHVTAVVEPNDPAYISLARGFNQRFVGQPRAILVCSTPDEVRAALQYALTENQRVTVRCGGHCYEGFVADNDGIVIDLTPLDQVSREGERFCVEGGSSLWNVYNKLCRTHGVTLPGGSCYSVGIGGHVIGGGYGLLSRKYGLISDYLREIELVRVNADRRVELVRVSPASGTHEERELFWAHCGGGGGNFGIVTRFWFDDLPRVPGEVTLKTVAWNWKDLDRAAFGRLLHAYGDFFAEHSAPADPYNGLFTLFVLGQGKASQLTLTLQSIDGEEAIEALLARMTANAPAYVHQTVQVGYHAVQPHADTRRLPWLEATQNLNSSGPNRRGKYKSAYMVKPFPEAQLDTMWHFLHEVKVPTTDFSGVLQLDSYGGRINALAPDASPIPQRSSILKLQYQVYWNHEKEDDTCLGWIRGFYDAMYGPKGPWPDGVMDGCYVNYPDVDLKDWQHLYYKDGYQRLRAVKTRWDPLNIFHHRQSIEGS